MNLNIYEPITVRKLKQLLNDKDIRYDNYEIILMETRNVQNHMRIVVSHKEQFIILEYYRPKR
jgi:hypothetical protein